MSTTPIQDQAEKLNPYIAPKSQASLRVGKFLTFVLICCVVAGFTSAGTFAYWRLTTPDAPEEEPEIVFERHRPD